MRQAQQLINWFGPDQTNNVTMPKISFKKKIITECNTGLFRIAQNLHSCLEIWLSTLMTGKLTLTCKIGRVPPLNCRLFSAATEVKPPSLQYEINSQVWNPYPLIFEPLRSDFMSCEVQAPQWFDSFGEDGDNLYKYDYVQESKRSETICKPREPYFLLQS